MIEKRLLLVSTCYATSLQWNALPWEMGASSTVHDRFQEWKQKGFFKVLWQAGLTEYDEVRGRAVNPITLCILIGIQGFLMTLIGITLGCALRARLRIVKEWSELLSAFLLIGLGIWLLVAG